MRAVRSHRKAGKADLQKELLEKVSRTLSNLNAGATIMTRRLTSLGTVVTSVGGLIALTTLASSSAVSSATDFASMANLFVAYRVKALRVRLFPVFVANIAGVAPPPCQLCADVYSSGLSVTTYANMLDSAACQLWSGYSPKTLAANWDGLPDAHLWTPNNAAITANEAYGILLIGASGNTASQVSTTYYTYVVEYEAEFITAA